MQQRAVAARKSYPVMLAPRVTRDMEGVVTVTSQATTGRLMVSLDDGDWQSYTGPFDAVEAVRIRAWVEYDADLCSDVVEVELPAIVPMLVLDKANWQVIHTDSAEPGEGESQHAIDGKTSTFWHTRWSQARDPHPHEIQIDLGASKTILAWVQWPRQDSANGRIRQYEFYISDDPQQWGTPVSQGKFPNVGTAQRVTLESPVKGRYIRLKALDEWGGEYYTTIGELDVMVAK